MLLARRVYIANCTVFRNYQVTVLGAATEIGQCTSLLLRSEPSISKLNIHDTLEHTAGVATDLSHVPSQSTLVSYTGKESLDKALKGSDIVIATGGVIARPGLIKKSWFSTNTAFIKSVAAKIAKTDPMPFVGIVTEPINSTVPMAAEIMRNHGNFDGKKLFGITVIDAIRAQYLFANDNNFNPCDCAVPVIGGHSNKTTIPLLSQAVPIIGLDEKCMQEFTAKVRNFDSAVTKAKMGFAPTVSIAYSVLLFVRHLINALEGHPSKVNAYVENNDFGTSYFSGLVTVTKEGAQEIRRYSNLFPYECSLLERSIEQLRKDISKGTKVLETS